MQDPKGKGGVGSPGRGHPRLPVPGWKNGGTTPEPPTQPLVALQQGCWESVGDKTPHGKGREAWAAPPGLGPPPDFPGAHPARCWGLHRPPQIGKEMGTRGRRRRRVRKQLCGAGSRAWAGGKPQEISSLGNS